VAPRLGGDYNQRVTAPSLPQVVTPRSRIETALEVVSVSSVLAALGIVGSFWDALPERVPRHFGAAGNPDAFGSKGNILIPALLAVGLYVLLTLIQRIPPRLYNYPVRISADNAVAQYSAARACLAAIKAAVSVLLACGTWLTVQVALGHRQGLGGWFLPGLLVAIILPMVWYGSAAFRHRKA
jgi:uncharacterized membrane protein